MNGVDVIDQLISSIESKGGVLYLCGEQCGDLNV